MGKITIEDKIEQEIKELLANKDFVANVEDLRNRAISAHLALGDACQEEHNKIDEPFDIEAEKLRLKYKISAPGLLYFQNFVFTGKFDTEHRENMIEPLYLNPSLTFSGTHNNNEFLSIQIHRLTTLDDIKKAWPSIQMHFKNTPLKKKRFKIKKNIDRDLEVVKLKQAGKKSSEIVRIINDKYRDTLITYEYVSKIIKRLKT